jgi:ATP/maltotriose-dependent transcriptional regulator MalT
VTGRSDTGGQLTRLKERNLFLIELGRGVYRYHQLFADLLRYRLRAEDPDREHALHRRAAAFSSPYIRMPRGIRASMSMEYFQSRSWRT